ncbi:MULTISPECIES: hypothetical protein [unclassified Clostridioides]|uniref:hypothetical protein n=1 Tax=unclassified Clostridioides TaxID=2635829 RepID=UPI001D114356|nr:hypothetical protein [Clostridioides sp. ES-W-0018-02]MCC0713065.1 hypothetical protein [Clostridioides sp. ES-W-0017-02]
MDEKILELLQEMQGEIKGINTRLDGIENEVKEVKADMGNRFDEVDKKLDYIHKDILIAKTDINEVDKHLDRIDNNMNFVEMATSKNWNEIARLKSIK